MTSLIMAEQYPFCFPRRVISHILSLLLTPDLSATVTVCSLPSLLDCLSFAAAFPKYGNEVREQCLPLVTSIDFLQPHTRHSEMITFHKLSSQFTSIIPSLPLVCRHSLRHIVLPPTLDRNTFSSFITSIWNYAPNVQSFSFHDDGIVDELIAFNIGTFPNLLQLEVTSPTSVSIPFLSSLFSKLKQLSICNINPLELYCLAQTLQARSTINLKLEEFSISFVNNGPCISVLKNAQVAEFLRYLHFYAISNLSLLKHMHVAVNCQSSRKSLKKHDCQSALQILKERLTPSFPLCTALHMSVLPVASSTNGNKRSAIDLQPPTFSYVWYFDVDVERFLTTNDNNNDYNKTDGLLVEKTDSIDALKNFTTLSISKVGHIATNLVHYESLQNAMTEKLKIARRINRINLFQSQISQGFAKQEWKNDVAVTKIVHSKNRQYSPSSSSSSQQAYFKSPSEKLLILCEHLENLPSVHTIELGMAFFVQAAEVFEDDVYRQFLQSFPKLSTLYLCRGYRIQKLTFTVCTTLLDQVSSFLCAVRHVASINNRMFGDPGYEYPLKCIEMDAGYFETVAMSKKSIDLFKTMFNTGLDRIGREMALLRLEQRQIALDSVIANVDKLKIDLRTYERSISQ